MPIDLAELKQDIEEICGSAEARMFMIRQRLEEIDEERHQLQEMLGSYETVLRSLNGEETHEAPERKPKRQPKQQPSEFSEARLQAVTAWLRKNRGWLNEGSGFSVPTLFREHEDAVAESPLPKNQSGLSRILRELQQWEVVTSTQGNGPRSEKFYKVR